MMTPWRVSLAHYYSLSITVPENCSRRSQQRRVVTLTTPNYLPIVDFNSQFAMRKRSKGLTRAHCTLGARIARDLLGCGSRSSVCMVCTVWWDGPADERFVCQEGILLRAAVLYAGICSLKVSPRILGFPHCPGPRPRPCYRFQRWPVISCLTAG